MQVRNLLGTIGDWTADPLEAKIGMMLWDAIENKTPLGKMIIRIAEYAEKGDFK